ncbi:hypothetical protein AAC387_Pa02g0945 [Persea americana]
MCQSATVFQLDGRIKTTLARNISPSALEFQRGRRHSGNSDGHLPHPFSGNGNRSEASCWSMEPAPVTMRDYPSLIPSGREKPSTVTIVLIIVSLVILLVIISCLVRFYIKRGCSSRSPVVAPLPEVELA